MSVPEAIKRYTYMFIGLFVCAFGLAACIKADMGISPVTTIAYVLHELFPAISRGMFVFCQNMMFLVLTIALLRRQFKPFYLLMVPCSFLFGWFVDLGELILAPVPLPNYPVQLVFLLLANLIVGLGFSIMVTSGVALDANTVFVNALVYRTGKTYSKMKIISDVCIVLLSALIGLIFLHRVAGIREGTVISALLVGRVAGFFNKRLAGVEHFFKGGREQNGPVAPAQ